jgi:FkbM family methyltransferase
VGVRPLVRRVAMIPVVNHAATTGLRAAGRRVPRVSAWGVHRMPRVGVSAARIAGGPPILLDGGAQPDWITHRCYWSGVDAYEPEVLPLFAALVGDSGVVIDAGANIGLYALVALRANPNARVFAFEPASDVFATLRRNISINAANGIVAVRAALGSAAGVTPIYTPADKVDSIGSAEIAHRVTWTPGPWQCEYAHVVTLDDFVATNRLKTVDVLKIDVEGAEDHVLTGARETIARHRPHIFCELLETAAGERAAVLLRDLLEPLGYHAYSLTSRGPEPRVTIEPSADWNHLLTTLDPDELEAVLRKQNAG